MNFYKYPIIFIIGYTATGKTNLSIKLKKKISILDLISVDSVSIFRQMDIGSSKPSNFFLKNNTYKLINIRDPKQNYSVYNFYIDSFKIINNCIKNKKIPIFVGGNIYYFNILLNGIYNSYFYDIKNIKNFIEININEKNIKKIYNNYINNYINNNNLNIKNKFRFYKNILISIIQGNINLNKKNNNLYNKYDIYQYFLNYNSNLDKYKIINNRFLYMLKNNFENEVYNLFNRGDLSIKNQSIKSIGYKEMWLYIDNKLSYNNMFDNVIKKTMNLIKKQKKWIKNWKYNVNYITNNHMSFKKIIDNIYNIIDKYNKLL